MPAKSKPKKKVKCPKCEQEMDQRGDGVLVCGDCGWEIKPDDKE